MGKTMEVREAVSLSMCTLDERQHHALRQRFINGWPQRFREFDAFG